MFLQILDFLNFFQNISKASVCASGSNFNIIINALIN